jgi:hypothetical protein
MTAPAKSGRDPSSVPSILSPRKRSQSRALPGGRVATAMAQAPPLTLILPGKIIGTYRKDGETRGGLFPPGCQPALDSVSTPRSTPDQALGPGHDRENALSDDVPQQRARASGPEDPEDTEPGGQAPALQGVTDRAPTAIVSAARECWATARCYGHHESSYRFEGLVPAAPCSSREPPLLFLFQSPKRAGGSEDRTATQLLDLPGHQRS